MAQVEQTSNSDQVRTIAVKAQTIQEKYTYLIKVSEVYFLFSFGSLFFSSSGNEFQNTKKKKGFYAL